LTFVLVSTKQHVDGAGKVDGSVVVALPIDRWSAPESENAFEGGGLTFWDGGNEIHYDTRSGDLALIDRYVVSHDKLSSLGFMVDFVFDVRCSSYILKITGCLRIVSLFRAVWHQADPITKGKRWALVIFYRVER